MAQDFNSMLYRPIRNGREYDSLIKPSKCKSAPLGAGDTGFTVSEMVGLVTDTSHTVEALAPIFQKNKTIPDLCNSIYDFLYWHIQYTADNELQQLRSAACSWSTRNQGIDCKSFSIFAASILHQLGINFYIRRISQPGYFPTEFSHVYIVVPLDQQSNSLSAYAVIDATTHDNIEPQFVKKSDEFMKGLQHVGLYGANSQQTISETPNTKPILNESFWNSLGTKIKNLNLGGLLTWIKCLGSASFSDSKLNAMREHTAKYFSDLFIEINQAVNDNDAVRLSEKVAQFDVLTKAMPVVYQKSLDGKNWKNGCTKSNLKTARQIFEYYRDKVKPALNAWLDFYFVKNGHRAVYNLRIDGAVMEQPPYSFEHAHIRGAAPWVEQSLLYNYDLKDKTNSVEIKAFEFTSYAADKSGHPDFNPVQFIGSLGSVIASFQPNNANGGNFGNGGNYDEYHISEDNKKQTSASSILIVAGLIIAGSTLFKKQNNGK